MEIEKKTSIMYVAILDRPLIDVAVASIKQRYSSYIEDSQAPSLLSGVLLIYNNKFVGKLGRNDVLLKFDSEDRFNEELAKSGLNNGGYNGGYIVIDTLEYLRQQFSSFSAQGIRHVVESVNPEYVKTVLMQNAFKDKKEDILIYEYQKKDSVDRPPKDHEAVRSMRDKKNALFMYAESGMDIEYGILDSFSIKRIWYGLWMKFNKIN